MSRKEDEIHQSISRVDYVNKRTLMIAGEIGPQTVAEFMVHFTQMDATKGPITIKLFSPGGDVPSGWAIYDIIRGARNKVTIEGYGEICSIAALIFMAADDRAMSRNCRFMIHDGHVELGALELNALNKRAKEISTLNDRCNIVIAERSGQTYDDIQKWSRGETFFSAEECIDLGFAHRLLHPKKR